jgi:8-oxo-dGTP pyrophosphatase MutT (NUDIX family)
METRLSEFSKSYWGRLRAGMGRQRLMVIGTRVVVERPDGHILLQLRRDFDLWGLPGGNAEDDESIAASGARELREETGLIAQDLTPFGYASDPRFEYLTFPNGDPCHFHAMLFCVRDFAGDLLAETAESRAVAWHDPQVMPPCLPNLARSLEAYSRYRETAVFQLI